MPCRHEDQSFDPRNSTKAGWVWYPIWEVETGDSWSQLLVRLAKTVSSRVNQRAHLSRYGREYLRGIRTLLSVNLRTLQATCIHPHASLNIHTHIPTQNIVYNSRAGKVTLLLRALTALTEDPFLVPSTTGWLITTCNCKAREPDALFWPLALDTHDRQKTQAKYP